MTREVSDLDGGSFTVSDQQPLSLRLLADLQVWMLLLDTRGGRETTLWRRLECAETYLIARLARNDDAETILAPELGGEG